MWSVFLSKFDTFLIQARYDQCFENRNTDHTQQVVFPIKIWYVFDPGTLWSVFGKFETLITQNRWCFLSKFWYVFDPGHAMISVWKIKHWLHKTGGVSYQNLIRFWSRHAVISVWKIETLITQNRWCFLSKICEFNVQKCFGETFDRDLWSYWFKQKHRYPC